MAAATVAGAFRRPLNKHHSGLRRNDELTVAGLCLFKGCLDPAGLDSLLIRIHRIRG